MAPLNAAAHVVGESALLRRNVNENGSWQGGLTGAGVDLVAMVVSDSGLSSIVPQWWNASPLGCILIGSQPRGGWQIFQRAAQWGDDMWAHAFGVNCTKPILYEYFACSMRNRIEVWNSPRWISPMEGGQESNHWQPVGDAKLARPTKLIDGSRGGQAFICSLVRPKVNQRYPIGQQARAQLQSIILVAAGFMDLSASTGVEELRQALKEDFEFSDRLGVVFSRLLPVVIVLNVVVLVVVVTVFYSLWADNFYSRFSPYMIQLCSFASWAVGATGLLMMGGNPRIKLVSQDLPKLVEDRIQTALANQERRTSTGSDQDVATIEVVEQDTKPINNGIAEEKNDIHISELPMDKIEIEFGSLHGSIYTPDYGTCLVPIEVARAVCSWDLEYARGWKWFAGVVWFGIMLLFSVMLQIAGIKCATIWSEIMGVVLLIVTSVLRGTGISGREEWLIPRWKTRAHYGARLQGVLESRNYMA